MASQPQGETDGIRTSSIDGDRIALVHLESMQTPEYDDADSENSLETVSFNGQRKTHLTFLNGLALVIGLQIGSGVFAAPSQVSAYVPSPALAISAWLLGGVLVYTGAMAFVELGIALPRNGGIQEYLRHAYGEFAGCLFTWTWLTISKPSAMAIISMVFSDYLCRTVLPEHWMSTTLEKVVALLGLILITSVNCLGIRSGVLVANGFLGLKLFTLLSLAGAGIVFTIISGPTGIASDPGGWFESATTESTESSWSSFGNYITALYGVLFCYGGWESIGFVAGEINYPSRDLPRILNTAMVLTITGFTLFNVAIYCVVPLLVIRDSKTPVMELGAQVFGPQVASMYSILVAASAIGALNANVYATGRLYVSAADRGYLPTFLSELRESRTPTPNEPWATKLQFFVPLHLRSLLKVVADTISITGGDKALSRAMIANSCVVSLYILGGTFDSLVTFVGISEYLLFFLVVVGTFRIRKNFPKIVIYRTSSWYIVVFCTISFLLVLRGIITSPQQGISIGVLASLCWLIYRSISNQGEKPPLAA